MQATVKWSSEAAVTVTFIQMVCRRVVFYYLVNPWKCSLWKFNAKVVQKEYFIIFSVKFTVLNIQDGHSERKEEDLVRRNRESLKVKYPMKYSMIYGWSSGKRNAIWEWEDASTFDHFPCSRLLKAPMLFHSLWITERKFIQKKGKFPLYMWITVYEMVVNL